MHKRYHIRPNSSWRWRPPRPHTGSAKPALSESTVDMPFADYQTALVTGASSGIGAGIVERMTREGLTVHAVSRNRDRLQSLAQQTGCIAHALDIRCQSASNFDPASASNFDPFERRVLAVALAPSELAGVAETARARVV